VKNELKEAKELELFAKEKPDFAKFKFDELSRRLEHRKKRESTLFGGIESMKSNKKPKFSFQFFQSVALNRKGKEISHEMNRRRYAAAAAATTASTGFKHTSKCVRVRERGVERWQR